MNTLLELVAIWLKVFLRELMIFKSPRGHSGPRGNLEMSELFGRKIPIAILPFSCNFNHNSPEPNTLRPRGFRLCEPFGSY